VVVSVEKDTPAARKGIKPGDIITKIDHRFIGNQKQFRDALRKADLKKGVIVKLVSGDSSRSEVLKAGEE
jgi:S1-C subfamily serine protease